MLSLLMSSPLAMWLACLLLLAQTFQPAAFAHCAVGEAVERMQTLSLLQKDFAISHRSREQSIDTSQKSKLSELPFANVLLIVMRVYADKVPVIQRAYGPYFQDVVFVGPHKDSTDSNETELLRTQGYAVDDCIEQLDVDYDVTYACVGRLLGRLGRATDKSSRDSRSQWEVSLHARALENPLRGALVMHADFWISPSFDKHVNLDYLGQLAKSSKTETRDDLDEKMQMPLNESKEEWMWWAWGHLQLLDAASAALVSKGLRVDSSTITRRWSDLYYVPQEAWLVFSQAASLVGQKFSRIGQEAASEYCRKWDASNTTLECCVGVWKSGVCRRTQLGVLLNEAAVPLVIEAVLQHAVCKAGRCSVMEVENCWGGPENSTSDPHILQQYPCGHSMNLEAPEIRSGLLAMWASSNTSKRWPLSDGGASLYDFEA